MRKTIAFIFVTCALYLVGCSTTRPTEKALIGKWESSHGGITYQFRADATYIYSQSSPAMTWQGRYEVETPNLLILTKQDGASESMQFVLKGSTLKRLSNIDGGVEDFRKIDK